MPIPQVLNTEPFTRYMEIIRMLYNEDEDFKALCDDYETSKQKTEKYKGKSLEDFKSGLEYQQLSIELEKEILEYIMKLK